MFVEFVQKNTETPQFQRFIKHRQTIEYNLRYRHPIEEKRSKYVRLQRAPMTQFIRVLNDEHARAHGVKSRLSQLQPMQEVATETGTSDSTDHAC